MALISGKNVEKAGTAGEAPLRLRGILQGKVLAGPRRLEVEINTRCNLNCVFCWFHSPGSKVKMQDWSLELDVFKRIMDDAQALGVEHVYITGRGEPCLHPDLPAMLRYAKQKRFAVTLTTNLTVFSKELLAALLLVDKLEVTFCGFPEERYQMVHRPKSAGAFARAVMNMSRIARIAAKRKKPFIKVNYILTRKNISAVEEMVEFCRETGVQEIRLSPFSFTPHTHALRPTAAQLKALQNRLRSIPQEGLTIDRLWFDMKAVQVKKCYMGWMAVLVGVYGRVKIGCFDSPLPDDGNIYERSLKEIWVSRRAQGNRLQLRDSLKELNFCAPSVGSAKISGVSCPFTDDNLRISEAVSSLPPR